MSIDVPIILDVSFNGESTMHKTLSAALGVVLVSGVSVPGYSTSQFEGCVTIKDGMLETSEGYFIEPGRDMWGYNYQSRQFNGTYCDSYRDAAWCQPYADIELLMKWNDAWLSNRDCDEDMLLDRHHGYDSYIGSGAWITNHMSGIEDGEHWTYFVKIVAAPADATSSGGIWYDAEGNEIGPVIWRDFAILLENTTGPSSAGLEYRSLVGPGFGSW